MHGQEDRLTPPPKKKPLENKRNIQTKTLPMYQTCYIESPNSVPLPLVFHGNDCSHC